MRIPGIDCEFEQLIAPFAAWHARLERSEWQAIAEQLVASGAHLISTWGSDRRHIDGNFQVSVTLSSPHGLIWLTLRVSGQSPSYPDLTHLSGAVSRMQRATFDLMGLVADGAADRRPWLRHSAWPADYFPLRHENTGLEDFPATRDDYAVVPVEGDGVHEIAVGPVHAGTIEPGHFRLSVVGEKVLRLEERLGYAHKGIEKLFERTPMARGHILAARVSGDATIAFGWAYCMAVEALTATPVPPRALWLRALMLENERVANHLGDLGALGNDAGLAFGLAQFSRLREDWLRLNAEIFGHRLLMDRVVPGGVAIDLGALDSEQILKLCKAIEHEVTILKDIYEGHAGLQDRLVTTGRVTRQLALQLGLTGLAARASGLAGDLRVDHPSCPYDQVRINPAVQMNGDVAARVLVRFAETFESLRLIRQLLVDMPTGQTLAPLGASRPSAFGAGWIEGWRGEVLVAIETDGEGAIARCHCHDPSWHNWPVVEHAIIGNIVPDFPLINKSFNLSYSGHDL